jgi:hypothetical protein
MMWSTDYPHLGNDWPRSGKVIMETMGHIDRSERPRVCAGNAVGIFSLDRCLVQSFQEKDGLVSTTHGAGRLRAPCQQSFGGVRSMPLCFFPPRQHPSRCLCQYERVVDVGTYRRQG